MKPKPSHFVIEKCNDCLRITRIDNDKDMHTHCHSRKLANTIVKNVCDEKIPLHSHTRTLESMSRLTTNTKYKNKILELLKTREQKGNKPDYVNPGVKKSF